MSKWNALLGLGVLIVATPAGAGTLATAALFSGPGNSVVCMLSNVAATPLGDVTVDVKDGSGGSAAATASSIDCPSELPPGVSCFLNKTLAGAQRVRCEFRFHGLTKKARGVMVLDDGTRVLTLDAR